MKIKLLTLLLFVVFFVKSGVAQTIHVDSTKHTQGTTEVIVFSSDKPGGSLNSPRHVGHDKNIVKVALLYWVQGNIPAYYERQINKWLSIQGGVGITTRDFMADLVNEAIVQNDYADYQHRKALVGFYVSAQPKFWINNDAMDGFYISPILEFKRYNFKAQMVDETQTEQVYLPNTYMNEHRNALDFTVNIGWQWMYNPLVLEFYMGAGFRRFWEQRLDIEQNDVTNTYTNGVRNYGGFRPEVNVCFSFGGFF